jgi:hypothetical protein
MVGTWIACFEVVTMDAKSFSYYVHEIIMYGWYLPPQKNPLAGNRFFQTGNGAENTKKNPGSALDIILKVQQFKFCIQS